MPVGSLAPVMLRLVVSGWSQQHQLRITAIFTVGKERGVLSPRWPHAASHQGVSGGGGPVSESPLPCEVFVTSSGAETEFSLPFVFLTHAAGKTESTH